MPYQSKNWVFTLNNPGEEKPELWVGVQWGVYQHEKGESGTEHLQGYVVLGKKSTLSGVRQLCDRAHWEIRRGTHDEARAYCTKSETRVADTQPTEWGVPPKGQGARSDLSAVQEAIDSGTDAVGIAKEFFGAWCRYHKAFDAYRTLTAVGRSSAEGVETFVFYGPPGTGKTRLAEYLAGPEAYWLPAPNASGGPLWWDGYEGQDTVIIDEFYGWIPHPTMLRICDRYPLTVQVKGGTRRLAVTRVFITSNKHPVHWWPRSGLGAMERRITAPSGGVYHLQEETAPDTWVAAHPENMPACGCDECSRGVQASSSALNGFGRFVNNDGV